MFNSSDHRYFIKYFNTFLNPSMRKSYKLKEENNFVKILYFVAKNSTILIRSLPFEENKKFKCFCLIDGEDVPSIACVWYVFNRQFIDLKLENQNVKKIRIKSDRILLFSDRYSKGISLVLEKDDSGKLRIPSGNIIEYSVDYGDGNK